MLRASPLRRRGGAPPQRSKPAGDGADRWSTGATVNRMMPCKRASPARASLSILTGPGARSAVSPFLMRRRTLPTRHTAIDGHHLSCVAVAGAGGATRALRRHRRSPGTLRPPASHRPPEEPGSASSAHARRRVSGACGAHATARAACGRDVGPVGPGAGEPRALGGAPGREPAGAGEARSGSAPARAGWPRAAGRWRRCCASAISKGIWSQRARFEGLRRPDRAHRVPCGAHAAQRHTLIINAVRRRRRPPRRADIPPRWSRRGKRTMATGIKKSNPPGAP